MKKKNLFLIFLMLCQFILAQSNDYRTTEDGINKLLSSEEFLKDLNSLETDLSLDKIDYYLTKYVPEYAGFKVKNKIDFNAIYYANTGGVSSDLIAGKMSKMFGLDNGQTQMLNSALSGNLTYNSTNPYSTGLSGQFYERGKDARTDFAVDYASDFFQNKFGDGGLNSTLIDVGAGLLGKLIYNVNKRYNEKMAQQAFEYKLLAEKNVFFMGSLGVYEKLYLTKERKKGGFKYNEDQSDLYSHYLARKYMPIMQDPKLVSTINYNKAIENLNNAIKYYLQNPNRAYYLYLAYTDRAFCKMNIGAYRAAIIDYYQGQKILELILKGDLKDYSIGFDNEVINKSIIGLLKKSDVVSVLAGRSYAKYRNKDYNGAIADANEGIKIATTLPYKGPNDYKDVLGAIIAMSQYSKGNIKESFNTFSNLNLNDDFIADNNNDLLINFKEFNSDYTVKYYTLPSYFPFDIVQIKGLAMYSEGKIDEAIASYTNIYNAEYDVAYFSKDSKRIFTKNNGDISALISSLSSFYFKKGDRNKAFEMINKAIELNRDIPEYYLKRAGYYKSVNKIKEANQDFEIAKNPKEYYGNIALKSEAKTTSKSITKNNTKSTEYYTTEYTKHHESGNYLKEYDIIKEALSTDNKNEKFILWARMYLNITKNKDHAIEIGKYFEINSKEYYLIMAMNSRFNNDIAKEEEFVNKAIESGYNLYDLYSLEIHPQSRFLIQDKSYFCKTFSKFVSRSNNSFIEKNFDKMTVVKKIESIYLDLAKKHPTLDLNSPIIVESKKKSISKLSGEYEEYLKILDSNKMLLEMSPIDAYDKFECLFILGKKEEALSFVKKVFSKGKFLKPTDENIDPNAKFSNVYYYAIKNLAINGCE
ncbi:tetratricopeptide repeat protein [Flavobacterium sp.]|jgi:hypothetical protein|uniref:tetratricopeptide repeat protein n=1 Tax=Flavobacterium sp. TaxID=239 RepID=UPI00378429A8